MGNDLVFKILMTLIIIVMFSVVGLGICVEAGAVMFIGVLTVASIISGVGIFVFLILYIWGRW
jgi:hypothetical protein